MNRNSKDYLWGQYHFYTKSLAHLRETDPYNSVMETFYLKQIARLTLRLR